MGRRAQGVLQKENVFGYRHRYGDTCESHVMPSSDIIEFRKVVESSKNIIVLSGAGLSAPSGTFIKRMEMEHNPAFT